MVARQLKIVSKIDAFTISATMNIQTQYVFKKIVRLIVVFFERHMTFIEITYIILFFHYT